MAGPWLGGRGARTEGCLSGYAVPARLCQDIPRALNFLRRTLKALSHAHRRRAPAARHHTHRPDTH